GARVRQRVPCAFAPCAATCWPCARARSWTPRTARTSGVFRSFETDLGFHLKEFALMQALMSGSGLIFNPMWAIIVDHQLLGVNGVMAITSLGWGVTTLVLGVFAHSIGGVISLRFVNVMFLCSGMPVGQHIVSSLIPPGRRGTAFSVIGVCGSVGVVASTKLSTTVSELRIFGMIGWRFGLVTIGVASVLFSMFIPCCLRHDAADQKSSRPEGEGVLAEVRQNLRDFSRIRSFWDIALFCSMYQVSLQAMMYSAMWLQYRGLSNAQVGTLIAWDSTGVTMGHWAFGALSDVVAKRYSLRGRLLLGQVCCGSIVPLSLILFGMAPSASGSAATAGVLFFTLGFFEGGWSVGVNRVVLTMVVPKSQASSLMAWKSVLEQLCGMLIVPVLVGLSAWRHGYESSDLPASQTPPAHMAKNATALSSMLRECVALSHVGMFLVYFVMHWHLEKDIDDLDARESVPVTDAKKAEYRFAAIGAATAWSDSPAPQSVAGGTCSKDREGCVED
ncbi:unnamed protein product, partial [Prorocentrum cordatum]